MTKEWVSVRTQEELQDCFRIRMKVFVEEQKVPQEEELDAYDASPAACHHVLLRIDGEPVATGRWRPYEGAPGAVKLQRVAVQAERRGEGLGRELILQMEQEAREAGFTAAILDGQCQAEAFYTKLGYAVISTEPFLDAGIWHVRMRKQL